MKRPHAVVTMVYGPEWWRVAAVSLPFMEGYANRINADFYVLTGRRAPILHPHWEKLRIQNMFEHYARVAWFDADTLIHMATPDLFQIVPKDSVGAMDEGLAPPRDEELRRAAAFYRIADPTADPSWRRYFNAGVLVLSGEEHHDLLNEPPRFFVSGMPEQTYLNLMLYYLELPYFSLPPCYNRIGTPPESQKTFIRHYAGWPKSDGWGAAMADRMKHDLENWG